MAHQQHRWGRSQKYHDRTRHLYALLFSDGCYIGQTVNLQARLKQHQSQAGGWAGHRFEMVPLGVVHGTQLDAEQYEFAWRYKAARNGWRIYGKPGVLINPYRRTTMHQRMLATTLKWPMEHRRGNGCLPIVLAVAALFVIAVLSNSGI